MGKFAPLHRGHELLIRRAFAECDEVVVITYSKPELPGYPAELREQWLAALFPDAQRLVVTEERLRGWTWLADRPDTLPENDATNEAHHTFCGFLCQRVLGVTVDAAFTSEPYGDEFGTNLTKYFRLRDATVPDVRHVMVDRARDIMPVSGTLLRGDIHGNRQWLAPEVYASFVRRVAIIGAESSGKTALSEALARELGTIHTASFGREPWEPHGGAPRFDDMLHIAQAQIAVEAVCARQANTFVVCDTTPLTTLFRARHLFGRADPALEECAARAYDVTVLCAPDFPFVPDGTRHTAELRTQQHDWYLSELHARGISFVLATGTLAERVAMVRRVLA